MNLLDYQKCEECGGVGSVETESGLKECLICKGRRYVCPLAVEADRLKLQGNDRHPIVIINDLKMKVDQLEKRVLRLERNER